MTNVLILDGKNPGFAMTEDDSRRIDELLGIVEPLAPVELQPEPKATEKRMSYRIPKTKNPAKGAHRRRSVDDVKKLLQTLDLPLDYVSPAKVGVYELPNGWLRTVFTYNKHRLNLPDIGLRGHKAKTFWAEVINGEIRSRRGGDA